ncbi:MAG: sel1 repeat family protein [Mesorhizobium sp.]|nr:MAG: sel1 repeat family protein [Mesorhizobium sp.]
MGLRGVEKDPKEAFKLFRQAAELGFSDASIRVGQLQENGKETECNPRAALESYAAAARAGNFFALAFLAQLLSKTSNLEQSLGFTITVLPLCQGDAARLCPKRAPLEAESEASLTCWQRSYPVRLYSR